MMLNKKQFQHKYDCFPKFIQVLVIPKWSLIGIF